MAWHERNRNRSATRHPCSHSLDESPVPQITLASSSASSMLSPGLRRPLISPLLTVFLLALLPALALATLTRLTEQLGIQYAEAITMPGSNAQMHASTGEWARGFLRPSMTVQELMGALRAINSRLLDDYIADCQGGIDRGHQEGLEVGQGFQRHVFLLAQPFIARKVGQPQQEQRGDQ